LPGGAIRGRARRRTTRRGPRARRRSGRRPLAVAPRVRRRCPPLRAVCRRAQQHVRAPRAVTRWRGPAASPEAARRARAKARRGLGGSRQDQRMASADPYHPLGRYTALQCGSSEPEASASASASALPCSRTAHAYQLAAADQTGTATCRGQRARERTCRGPTSKMAGTMPASARR